MRVFFSFISKLFIKLVVIVNVTLFLWITWFTRKKSGICQKYKHLGKPCMKS